MKLNKCIAMLLVCAMASTALAGCGGSQTSEDKSSDAETSEAVTYDPVIRDLPEPKYLEAAEAFAGGMGTESDPYQISSAEELALMEKLIREEEVADKTGYCDAHYVLTADIALNDTADFDQWAQSGPEYSWRPITGISVHCKFDGAGHTISGMYINTNSEDYGSEYGLFGRVFDGVVKNLTLDKSYISVSGPDPLVGGIVAAVNGEMEVTDCVSNVVIDVYDGTVGGVAGSVVGGRDSNDDKEYNYTEEDDRRGPFSVVKNCTFGGTINQVREKSMSFIGGIAGSNGGDISGCVNTGTINFDALDTDTVGGIVAKATGIISDCENAGSINCTIAPGAEEEVSLVRAGGIVGNLFMSATGSKKYMARVATVKNCKNTGYVSGTDSVGGIAGDANNDRNDWCLVISDCVNSGQVVSLNGNSVGGIAGRVTCLGDNDHGNNIVVENCRNEADLTQGTVGGIMGSLFSRSGATLVKNCSNTGNLSTSEEELYCGGIVAHWMMTSLDDDDAVQVTIENCSNAGNVTAPVSAGGIVAFAECPVKKAGNKKSSLVMKDCSNSGDVTARQNNGYIGGIIGSWGMDSIESMVENCTNTGNIILDNEKVSEEDLKAMEEGGFFTISRMCGGIIGRVGTTTLSTDNDKVDKKNVNKEGAYFTIKGCSSTGSLMVNDAEEYKTSDGERMYRNYFGGVIGNISGEDGFSVWVEDCIYSGFERGFGNDDLPDVGKKN